MLAVSNRRRARFGFVCTQERCLSHGGTVVRAIYREVTKDKSKIAGKEFSAVVGADVPAMIELYTLPDDALASVPAAKFYRYTVVENKVVVVDPTKMRVIDVIGPSPKQ